MSNLPDCQLPKWPGWATLAFGRCNRRARPQSGPRLAQAERERRSKSRTSVCFGGGGAAQICGSPQEPPGALGSRRATSCVAHMPHGHPQRCPAPRFSHPRRPGKRGPIGALRVKPPPDGPRRPPDYGSRESRRRGESHAQRAPAHRTRTARRSQDRARVASLARMARLAAWRLAARLLAPPFRASAVQTPPEATGASIVAGMALAGIGRRRAVFRHRRRALRAGTRRAVHPR